MLASRDDVVRCYRSVLKRDPESEAVIVRHLESAKTVWDLIGEFLDSDEKKTLDQASHEFSLHKCLAPAYLANAFDQDARIQCYTRNIDCVQKALNAAAFTSLIAGELTVHAFESANVRYDVTLSWSRTIAREGELSLRFNAAGAQLYILSFSFIPGRVVASAEDTVILISRMQGAGGKRDEMRAATKAADEIAPPAYLFSVLQGIAKAMRVSEVFAVQATNQVSYDPQFHDYIVRAYDEFFTTCGLEGPSPSGFYSGRLPLKSKSLLKTVSYHRLRTKFKRERRLVLIERACDNWKAFMRSSIAEMVPRPVALKVLEDA